MGQMAEEHIPAVAAAVQEAPETEDLLQEELLVQGQHSMEEMEEQVLTEAVMDCPEITMAGEEVVQLYLRAIQSSVPRPLKELRGFERVHLGPGERKSLQFRVQASDCAYYEPQLQGWQIERGLYEVLVGASSEDIRAKATFSIE